MKFYVYVDWTKEEIQRPFYVGKGIASRTLHLKRNYKHCNISKNFGIERRIVFETNDEIDAFNEEIKLTQELHTYINDPLSSDIACNFTLGGGGCTGINERTIEQRDNEKLIRTFSSVKELAMHFNTKSSVISNAFSGRGVFPIQMRQFVWKIQPMKSQMKKLTHKNSLKVLELDPNTNELICEHKSITAALKIAKISYTSFIAALRSHDDTLMKKLIKKTGSKWQLKDAVIKKRNGKSKPVVVEQNGIKKVFSSVTNAAEHLNVNVNKLLFVLHEGKSLNDVSCQFLNPADKSKNIKRSSDWHRKMNNINGIKVIKFTIDKKLIVEYGSYAEAERIEGYVNRELYKLLTVDKCIKFDGFIWERP